MTAPLGFFHALDHQSASKAMPHKLVDKIQSFKLDRIVPGNY
jgi:hypothetical protein